MSAKPILRMSIVALAVSCLGEPFENTELNAWCGESLCAWDEDEGEVRAVPTWHPDDRGLAFVSDPTRISQLASRVLTGRCFRFSYLADVADDARLYLSFDLGDDGRLDHSEAIDGKGFRRTTHYWRFPGATTTFPSGPINRVRLVLHKTGPGRAVLARMRITEERGASGCTPIAPDYRLGLGGNCD